MSGNWQHDVAVKFAEGASENLFVTEGILAALEMSYMLAGDENRG